MTNFVNIRIDADRLLDPELKILVDKLALDNPRWVFSQNGKSHESHTYQIGRTYSQTEEVQKALSAPEGFKYLRRVDVHHNDEMLGRIGVDTNYRRSSGKHWSYTITSWRIDNSRGARNTSTTTKLDVATRMIKKVFKPMDMREIMLSGQDAIGRGFFDAARTLRDPITQLRLIKGNVGLQAYALAKAMGEEITAPDLLAVEAQLKSETYQQAMAEYFLASAVDHDVAHHKLDTVIAVGGNQYIVRDDQGDVIRLNFEQMTEKMQSCVSVLHLMQDNEIVKDVGYRYNDTHFFVYK